MVADKYKKGALQKKLLALLAEGPAGVRELAVNAGTSDMAARVCLLNLERRGIVKSERVAGKASVWSLP